MEISDGGMTVVGYFRMCAGRDSDEMEKVRKGLLEYCRMDTLGMVRLYEKLRDMAGLLRISAGMETLSGSWIVAPRGRASSAFLIRRALFRIPGHRYLFAKIPGISSAGKGRLNK